MAYFTASAMRSASLAEYAFGLELDDESAISDTLLDAAIAGLSARFDNWTNDHFAAETLTLTLDGDGTDRILLPKRMTAITSLATTLYDGTVTTQSASNTYRLHSSLESTGDRRSEERELDYLEITWLGNGLSGTLNPYGFDSWSGSVTVTGTFGWTTTPRDVKRAVALLVYDHFKPMRADLRRATSWNTADASISVSTTTPSGIPEVDEIVAEYTRTTHLGVG